MRRSNKSAILTILYQLNMNQVSPAELRAVLEENPRLREEFANALARHNTTSTRQLARHSLDHYNHDGAVTKRPRTFSQQSAPTSSAMSRSRSSLSARSAVPFTGPGVQGPGPSFRGMEQQSGGMIGVWAHEDGPFTVGQPRARPQPSLPGASFGGSLENPDIFLQRRMGDEDLSSEHLPTMGTSNHLLSPGFCMAPPPLTEAPTAPSMSRENSQISTPIDSNSVAGPVEMMRLTSTQSDSVPFQSQDNSSAFSFNMSTPVKPCQDDLMHIGVGQSLKDPQQYPNSVPAEYLTPGPKSQPMSRSSSNESTQSNRSTASLKERAKGALVRQIEAGSRQASIKPKPSSEDQDQDNQTSDRGGAAGGKKDTKEAINRQPYQRPKHPKVYCRECDDYPEGFRGEHELRRHTDAKHKRLVTKWVVRDAFAAGMTALQPVSPISKCKSCTSGKYYGAYYNAAAHLRRAHFKPKTGRRGSRNSDPEEEKSRHGTGQEWPTMEEMKKWFYAVQVDCRSSAPASQASTEDISHPDDDHLISQVPVTPEMGDMDISNMGGGFDSVSFDISSPASMPPPPFGTDFNNLDILDELATSASTSISPNYDPMSIFNPSPQLSVELAGFDLTQSTPRSLQIPQDLSASTVGVIPNNFTEAWTSGMPSMIGDGLEVENDF